MVPTDKGQDNDFFLKTVPEVNLDMVDQRKMIIVIDHDETQKFRSLHNLFLCVSDADVELVIKSELIFRRSRRS